MAEHDTINNRAGEPTLETSVTIWLTLTVRMRLACAVVTVKEIQPSLPDLIRQSMRRFSMDHRVKPGGDEGEVSASSPVVTK